MDIPCPWWTTKRKWVNSGARWAGILTPSRTRRRTSATLTSAARPAESVGSSATTDSSTTWRTTSATCPKGWTVQVVNVSSLLKARATARDSTGSTLTESSATSTTSAGWAFPFSSLAPPASSTTSRPAFASSRTRRRGPAACRTTSWASFARPWAIAAACPSAITPDTQSRTTVATFSSASRTATPVWVAARSGWSSTPRLGRATSPAKCPAAKITTTKKRKIVRMMINKGQTKFFSWMMT